MGIINRIVKLFMKNRPILCSVKSVTNKELLLGKTALVIGGGTGIGLAIAQKLKESGAKVIVASRKKREIEGIESISWDISDCQGIDKKFAEIVKSYGQIDIIVNSQGICPDEDFRGHWDRVTCEDFELVFKTNTQSVFFIMQTACKYFLEKSIQGAHILNIASTEGLKGCYVPYGISKAAVVSMTKGMGKIMASHGIIINGIAPGATATSMMRIKAQNLNSTACKSGRMTLPEEIANVAQLLVSDMGANICGEIVVVDGGESLH